MNQGQNTESAIFVRCAAERLLELGHPASTVFSASRLGQAILAQAEPVADIASVAAFFQRAAQISLDPAFGLHLGQQTDLRKAGLLGYLALSAPDLGGFLTTLSRYAPLFGEKLFFDTSSLDRSGIMEWGHAAGGEPMGQYHEFLASLLVANLRLACGKRIIPAEVSFCHGRSTVSQELEAFFGRKPQFEAPVNRLRFVTDDLSAGLATGDARLHAILRSCADARLEDAGLGRADLVAQVRQRISHRLASGTAALETVASDLGMSPRTLSRKLSEQETSYFAILENLRLEMAKTYLRDSDLVLAEIAHLLGYRGLSSFNDAFKRWTGQSPGKFRRTG
ncbi:AraC family transcriptional regulator ligand-binding domain-containing protein [Phaeobacter sp. QD34_3]|uniref:AraC family transcriptional regulator n=1 Tax=unclassified Phaeobacter TaxID=2621772 RepID=UPI00237FA146|nr:MULTISPECIES: AraC family transcriptional regulator [unclassified Phaeobacter]MDE4131492.1 AraC family transcriptional regulator ligand-binding domain-containing protein [Phaeobacter sp. QD34_3]MDE4135419.1 AraC family transcriptional regulator ligand-binding domain-containing protein [Phaeobacter sp. QD34_24]MDE4175520.1 AraC family transcriptional regulator ligand-binding domain-containing protein [Phaeobacter sp. PT47_59]